MNRLAGELCHDCNGKKLEPGDLACFAGETDYAWEVLARKGDEPVYFLSTDPWIFLDNPHEGFVIILHPIHGLLDVPINPVEMRFISSGSVKSDE